MSVYSFRTVRLRQVVSSLICAFSYGWKLTSITLVVLPILTVGTSILERIQFSQMPRKTKAYASAASLAEEMIGAVKTVKMFEAQEKEVERFETNLKPARKTGIKRGLATAIGSGFVWTLTYASYALTYWYGIRFVIQSICSDKTDANMAPLR